MHIIAIRHGELGANNRLIDSSREEAEITAQRLMRHFPLSGMYVTSDLASRATANAVENKLKIPLHRRADGLSLADHSQSDLSTSELQAIEWSLEKANANGNGAHDEQLRGLYRSIGGWVTKIAAYNPNKLLVVAPAISIRTLGALASGGEFAATRPVEPGELYSFDLETAMPDIQLRMKQLAELSELDVQHQPVQLFDIAISAA